MSAYEHPDFTVYSDRIGPFWYIAHYRGLPDITGEGESSQEADLQLSMQYTDDAEHEEMLFAPADWRSE
jgi:hypothetical protein